MKAIAMSLALSILVMTDCRSQDSNKLPLYFDQPIMTDSTSTLFIPIRYNNELLTSNKIAFWGDYYANIIIYNFKTDTYKKLFEKDAYIQPLRNSSSYAVPNQLRNITSKWVFVLSKVFDYNNSGRIDEKDPLTLFAASLSGDSLKQLTQPNEDVVSVELYEKQGFALLKYRVDSDHNLIFRGGDKEYYFRKINLTDLNLGKPIMAR